MKPLVAGAVLAPLLAVMGCGAEPRSVGQVMSALTSCTTIRRGAGTVADATLSRSSKHQSLGGQPSLRVDKKDEALLRFDLSAIPSAAVVNSAVLKLYVPGEGGCDDDDDDDDDDDHRDGRGSRWHHDHGDHDSATVRIHRATRAWSESSVTYASFNQQFDPAVAGLLRTSRARAQKSADVKALVAAWVSGAAANQGFLLETTSGRNTVFVSSENASPSQRPALEVCYTTPDDHCAPNPCQNGATCQNGQSGYSCLCRPGFDGATCEHDINECAGAPCQNGATCTDGVNGYSCACAPGYAGTNCQVDINECAPSPCQNGATCTDRVSGYRCDCLPGFTGARCEIDIDECAGAPCQNGATCTDGANGYTCQCAAGYSGTNCETNINDCAGVVCQNGGTCVDGVNSHSCQCAAGFQGPSCEVNIDECASGPCQNGGACTDGIFSYTCRCAPGYSGANCQIDVDDCAAHPCQNGGICADGVNSYSCACQPGYSGTDCQTNVDDCASAPCQNGGTCVDGVSGYTCQCACGYTGTNCQTAPQPIHQWTFNDGTGRDDVSGAIGALRGGATIAGGRLIVDNSATAPNQSASGQSMIAPVPQTVSAKTLVAWVSLSSLNQHGGSALTLEDGAGDVFDAIDYAERTPSQWMSGSDDFARSPSDNGGAAETSTSGVMIAIVYGADSTITIYRNGAFYAGYTQGTLQTYSGGSALIGLRHSRCNFDCWLTGSIDEARIYAAELCPQQLAALAPAPYVSSGCSDGTREGFANDAQYPKIAACSGGWSIPGIRSSTTLNPACNRESGNSSANPSGAGCNVADLCAAGWHVCESATEVATNTGGSGCTDARVDGAFFAQREASFGSYICSDSGDLDTAQNDIWGCAGTGLLMSGLQTHRPCGVLNANTIDGCATIAAPWSCAGSANNLSEAAVVTKGGPDRGGVLCCHD